MNQARITLWVSLLLLALCGFLGYILLPYQAMIAQGVLKVFVGLGIVTLTLLLIVTLAVLVHKFALARQAKRYLTESARLDLQAREQALKIEWDAHQLSRFITLTRVPADAVGNYPVLMDIGEERLTFLPGGNFVQAQPHTYAPRLEYRYPKDLGATPAAVTPQEELALLPPPEVPTLAEQVQRGDTQMHEVESILGYDATGARRGAWNKLHSFFVVGGSGSGKSSTVAYYAALAVLHGARLLIVDPDAEEEESITRRLAPLAPFLLCPVGETPQTAGQVLKVARQELESPGTYAVLFIVDEFSTIMRDGRLGGAWRDVATPLAGCLEDYAQRGRKRRRTAIVIGQIVKATRTGGTELRASMTATFVHRIKPQQARLILDGQEASECEYLSTGEVMVLLNNSVSSYRMRVPYAAVADMHLVARIMLAHGATRRFDPRFHPVSSAELAPVGEDSKRTGNPLETPDESPWQAKVSRVRDLRAQQRTQRQILYQVWGVTPGGSPDYARAKEEYQQIVALLNVEPLTESED